jgi:hypothetical protein
VNFWSFFVREGQEAVILAGKSEAEISSAAAAPVSIEMSVAVSSELTIKVCG